MKAPERRAGPPRIVYAYLAIIVVTWAGNWPLMKLALDDASPLVFVLLRLVGTVVLMAPALHAMRVPLLPIPGERLGLFWVGHPDRDFARGRAAQPLPFDRGGDRLRRARAVHEPGAGRLDERADIARQRVSAARGAIAWAFGSCLYRRRIWRTGFWTQTFWQLVVSAPVVLAFALPQMTGEPIHWSVALVAILAYNWLVTTALGYFLWALALTAMPATTAGQVLALTPIGGFLLSTVIFGGAITADVIASIGLIVAGIILTLRA